MSYARSGPAPRPRRSTVLLVVGVLATWAVATAFVIAVAVKSAVGPVVFKLTPAHGVHLGDLAGMSFAYGAALVITVLMVVIWRRSG